MHHTAESATKQHTQCGCGGPRCKQQGSAAHLRSHDDARPAGSAIDILDERFARSEIEKVEYLEKKQPISQRASVPKVEQQEQAPVAPKSTLMPAKRHARRR